MTAVPIDWQAGCWKAGPECQGPRVEVLVAGDWAPIRDFSAPLKTDPEGVYGDLLPELRAADLRIVNLECPLTDRGTAMVKSGSVLKGAPGHIRGLTAIPFEVATLANNHVFDFGISGYTATRDLLKANQIRMVGAGLTASQAQQPLVLGKNGLKIGIVNFSEGEDLTAARGDHAGVCGWDVEQVAARIAELRPLVNGLIVICHGGLEYIPFPPPYVAAALQRLAAAGADLIVGHHPHVPQGIQIHNGVPICYSLGNFVFFQHTDLSFRKLGYVVKAVFNSRGLTRLRMVPYAIGARRLNLLNGRQRRWFFQQMAALSEPLDDFTQIRQAWHGYLAYYGKNGFTREVARIITELGQDPSKGAAMFRNRLTTLQHRHHWIDTLTRLMSGELEQAPDWAREQAEAYFTRRIADDGAP